MKRFIGLTLLLLSIFLLLGCDGLNFTNIIVTEGTNQTSVETNITSNVTEEGTDISTEIDTQTTITDSSDTSLPTTIINEYTIEFETNGGNIIVPFVFTLDDDIQLPIPEKEGHTFLGWAVDNETMSGIIDHTFVFDGSLTLYAKWLVNQYTISFDVFGGLDVEPIISEYNSTVTEPLEPTKEGYSFGGWYSDETFDTVYVFNTMPANDMTLYARWVVNEYTLSFVDEDAAILFTSNYDYGSDLTGISKPMPSKVGYTFNGWDQVVPDTMPSSHLTLTATYVINQYSIIFDSQGGSDVEMMRSNYDSLVSPPLEPTKEGYTFGGWYSDIELSMEYIFNTMPAEDMTVYAKWIINSYTLNFIDEDNTVLYTNEFDYGEDLSGLNVLEPTKTGYRFIGWNHALPLTMPSQSLTLIAEYQINQYTISFDINGGSAIDSITQDFDTQVETPINPIRLGYSFGGWYSNSDYTEIYSFNRMPSKDITIYIKWDVNTYDMTYNLYENPNTNEIIILNQGEEVILVSLGTAHSAALTSDGRLFTWGNNNSGQLGDGTIVSHFEPQEITSYFNLYDGEMIIDISLGVYHSSALTSMGRLFTWGNNSFGQLGNGTTTSSSLPIDITNYLGLANGVFISSISLGFNYSSAITSDGRLLIWGRNDHGQIGNGTTGIVMNAQDITDNFNLLADEVISEVSLGLYHSSALTSNGRLFTWGDNFFGQLGDGTKITRYSPVEITSNLNLNNGEFVIQTATGFYHSSILTSDGRIFTWGNNQYEQLGYTDVINPLLPYDITLMFDLDDNDHLIEISLGGFHSGALTDQGNIYMWGKCSSGQLGMNSTSNYHLPTMINSYFIKEENEGILVLSLSENNTSAISSTGKLYVWGDNQYGQIGDYSTTNKSSPVLVGFEASNMTNVHYAFLSDIEDFIPEKTGYTFGGWYQDIDLSVAFTLSTMPAENVVLFPKWNINAYTLQYIDEDGEVLFIKDMEYLSGLKDIISPIPSKAGYTFTGWDQLLPSVMPAENLTLKAVYSINQYMIFFNSNGGSTVNPIKQDYQSLVESPIGPTREGYTFDGWYSDSDLTQAYVFIVMPSTDIELFAKWQINTYTLQLNDEFGSMVYSNTFEYGADLSDVSMTIPEKTGYTFIGWSAELPETMPAKDCILSMVYKINQYSILFDSNGGSNIYAMTQNYDTNVLPPLEPTKEGYSFIGWYSDAVLTELYSFIMMPAEDMTLYAKWEINSYTISFDSQGGSFVVDISQLYQTAIIEPTSPLKEGYTFGGWYSDVNYGQAFMFDLMPGEDTILYAKWNINAYTLQFIDSDGTVLYTNDYDFGSDLGDVIEPIPNKEGYIFDGWDLVCPENMPAYNLTLKAVYSIKTYTITFDSDGGSSVETIIKPYDFNILEPEMPTKKGYNFVGWYSDSDLSVPYIFLTMPAANIVLYAKWSIGNYDINYYIYDTFNTDQVINLLPEEVMIDIATGNNHSAAITSLGRLFTWGDNGYGKLGNGTSTRSLSPIDITGYFNLNPGETIIKVSLGNTHSSAMTSEGRVFMWGKNDVGQLGIGSTITQLLPIEITSFLNLYDGEEVIDIALGMDDSAVLTSEGRLLTWGANQYGQLGNNSTSNELLPKDITSYFNLDIDEQITSISFGLNHASALTSRGRLFTWGYNNYGQLGNGTTNYTAIPIEINSYLSLEEGETIVNAFLSYDQSSAITTNGQVFTWGYNAWGQLGNGNWTFSPNPNPINITNRFDLTNDESITQIVFAKYHSSAVSSDGRVFTWGISYTGSPDSVLLFPEDITTYIDMVSDVSVSKVMLGVNYSVILTNSGRIFTWGINDKGQLGIGSTETQNLSLYIPFESPTIISETYQYLEDINDLTITKTGYTFVGWYRDIDLMTAFDSTTMPGQDVNLYAKWEPIIYTFEYIDDDGAVLYTEDFAYRSYLDQIIEPIPSKTGYTFSGWDIERPLIMPAQNLTIQATYSIKQYTISFNSNYGSSVEPITQDYDTVVIEPAPPIKDGHTFMGWYRNFTSTETYQFTLMPAYSMTLYAKWSINSYTFKFLNDDGSVLYEQVYEYNSDLTTIDIETPIKVGYTFLAWDRYVPHTMPANDVSIYATYTINRYTINFDSQDGTNVNSITQDYDTVVVAPAEPTKYGHTFGGWFSDDTLLNAYTFSTMPAEDLTLYAKWNVNVHLLKVIDEDGSVLLSSNIDYGSDLSLVQFPTPLKEGYTFDGWDIECPVAMPNEDLTLQVTYRINQYTISFDNNGGSYTFPIISDYETSVYKPADPSRTGYTFDGWYDDAELTEIYLFTIMPSENITVYAKWLAHNWITFNTNGGTFIPNKSYLPGTPVILPTNTFKTGYAFDGWYVDDIFLEPWTFTTMPEKDYTLYAKWIQTGVITFVSNGGNYIAPIVVNAGEQITLPSNPVKEGYTFVGWYKDVYFNIELSSIIMPNESFTLYAKWEENIRISFDSNGGSAVDDISQNAGSQINPPFNPVKEGYIFRGWYLDEELTNYFYFDYVVMPDYDITLYAKWSIAYTITFETNGGSELNTLTYYEGRSLSNLQTPTKPGYLFVDWYLDEALSVVSNYTTMPAQYLTLYAKWIEAFTIHFESNGGNVLVDIIALEDDIITSPRNPYRVGYRFDGWYKDLELTIPYYFNTMPAEDFTLYAKWLKTYSISFETNGGTYINTKVFIPGEAILLSYETINIGYELDGWYLDAGLTQTFTLTEMPSEDLTLYAKWVTRSYYTNFNMFDASDKSQIDLGYDETIIMVSVGDEHSGLLTSYGRLYMWGDNRYGKLGDGSYGDQYTPVEITEYFNLTPGEKIIQIALGLEHSMALTNLGNVYTWGSNEYGQLGNNSIYNESRPVKITTYFSLNSQEIITQISAGYWHNGAITNQGHVFTWGSNSGGRLGIGRTLINVAKTPRNITNSFNLGYGEIIIELSLGGWQSMALSSEGRIYTWGDNSYGGLGNGESIYTNQYAPAEITKYFNLSVEEKVISLSSGYQHSSAVTNQGRLFMWGQSKNGQIGDGRLTYSMLPLDITQYFNLSEGEMIVNSGLSTFSSSAFTSDNRVFTWGGNSYGVLGDGSTSTKTTPYDVTENMDLNDNEHILSSAYIEHMMVVTSDSRVITWGSNTNGQLGLGTTASHRLPVVLPVNQSDDFWVESHEVGAIYYVDQLERIGYEFDGWYRDSAGKIDFMIGTMWPYDINLFAFWKAIEFDVTYIMNDGVNNDLNPAIYTIESGIIQFSEPTRLGYNFLGWYDNPNFEGDIITSIDGGGLEDVTVYAKWEVNIYCHHVSFIDYNGTILDDNIIEYMTDISDLSIPIPTREGYTFTGWDQTLPTVMPDEDVILRATYTVNQYQLSSYVFEENQSPDIPLMPGETIVKILAEADYSAILTSHHRVLTWGSNWYGQLGDGTTTSRNYTVDITPNFDLHDSEYITDIVLGCDYAAAITSEARIFMWGRNTHGQLGIGSKEQENLPVSIMDGLQLSPGELIEQVSLGYNHSVAVTNQNRLFMWGDNTYGQLGNNTYVSELYPLDISSYISLNSGESIAKVSLGSIHSILLTDAGRVFIWGNNGGGQLGNGSYLSEPVPIEVTEHFNLAIGEIMIDIETGEDHLGALTNFGRVFEWGILWEDDYYIDDLFAYNTPFDLTSQFVLENDDQIISISFGGLHASAVSLEGRVFVWGSNDSGELGIGTYEAHATPVEIRSFENLQADDNILDIVFGNYHTLMLTSLGEIYVMGDNYYGQLLGQAIYECIIYPHALSVIQAMDYQRTIYDFDALINLYSPIKDTLTLSDWYLTSDYDTLMTLTHMPATHMSIYAYWDAIDYQIQYLLDGGINHANNPLDYSIFSDTIILSEPTRIGHTFIGWYDNEAGSGEVITSIDPNQSENITLYALWSILEYTISFDTLGGTNVDSITQDYQSLVTEPDSPSKTDLMFYGWFLDEELMLPYTFTTMPAEDIILYAKWDVIRYTITFESHGGGSITSLLIEPDANIPELEIPIKENYTFDGWYTDVDCLVAFELTLMPETDFILYAKWIENNIITFDTLGGTEVIAISQLSGTNIIAPENPTKTGYIFVGWYIDDEFIEKFEFDTTPEENIILYAKWMLPFTIFFETNGGSNINLMTLYEGASIPIFDKPTKPNHLFVGWYLDGLLTDIFDYTEMPAEDLTLYAKWVDGYTIRFETDGGTQIDTISLTTGLSLETPLPPIKEGYTFLGWYINEALTVLYDFEEIVINDLTLYASWKEIIGPKVDDYTYVLKEDGTYEISRYIGADIEVIIPLSYLGLAVTSIGERAFESRSVVSVTIPYGITSIGYRAFNTNSLIQVIIPNSVGIISDNAFYNFSSDHPLNPRFTIFTPFESLPAGWETEGNVFTKVVWGFVEMRQNGVLEYVVLSNNTVLIKGLAERNIDADIHIPETIDGMVVRRILPGAFYYNTSILNLTMPNTIEAIEQFTFYASKISSINISSSAAYIGESAFEGSSIANILIPASVTSIGNSAFKNARLLSSITFEEGSQLTTIGESAFEYANNLVTINFPASLTYIAYEAFWGARRLTTISFEEGSQLAYIGDSAFAYASSLTDIEIPASLTFIGGGAFYNTLWLTNQRLINPLVIYNNMLIDGRTATGDVILPDGLEIILPSSLLYNSNTTSIYIPASVTSIGKRAFYGASALTTITFAEGSQLSTIGEKAFYRANALTSIIIPASVITIGDWAFNDMDSLRSVIFAEGSQLTTIGERAFSSSSLLTNIYIPISVEVIGEYAFYYCSNLTIYAEAASRPSGWDWSWNASNCPVIWGYGS